MAQACGWLGGINVRVARCLRGLVAVVAASAVLGGCAQRPWTHRGAMVVESGGLAVEFVREIDRFTFVGPDGGPNLVLVEGLRREPDPGGGYTFFGGVYTWVSPQRSEIGWRDASGALLDWPPDPAIDRGPARVIAREAGGFTVRGPESRSGLREVKTFAVTGRYQAELRYALTNETGRTLEGGTWVNAAVDDDAHVAVRWGVESWDADGLVSERLDAMTREIDEERGWRLLRMRDARWEGGWKFYLGASDPSEPGTGGEIAVWRDGWWWHRRQLEMPNDRLIETGEGPVAMFIMPARGGATPLIEAELYGPVAEIVGGGSHTAVERWTLVRSDRPDLAVLHDAVTD